VPDHRMKDSGLPGMDNLMLLPLTALLTKVKSSARPQTARQEQLGWGSQEAL